MMKTLGCSLAGLGAQGSPLGRSHLDVQVGSSINQHLDHGFIPSSTGVHQWRHALCEANAHARLSANRAWGHVLHRCLPWEPDRGLLLDQLLIWDNPGSCARQEGLGLPLPGSGDIGHLNDE